MPMQVNKRTCPHGVQHDWAIDAADVCPHCKREKKVRENKHRCPFCSQVTMVFMSEYKYCNNPKCKEYYRFIRII